MRIIYKWQRGVDTFLFLTGNMLGSGFGGYDIKSDGGEISRVAGERGGCCALSDKERGESFSLATK